MVFGKLKRVGGRYSYTSAYDRPSGRTFLMVILKAEVKQVRLGRPKVKTLKKEIAVRNWGAIPMSVKVSLNEKTPHL